MTATLHADKGILRLESVLMKLGAACAKAPAASRLIDVDIPHAGTAFAFKLNRNKCPHRFYSIVLPNGLRRASVDSGACGIRAGTPDPTSGAPVSERVVPLDDLSGWTLPPPSTRDALLVRAFDTAEAAIAFLSAV